MTAILPPARTPFTNPDGTPTRPFYGYLQQVAAPDTSGLVRDIATISERLGSGDGTTASIPAPLFNYVGLGGILVKQRGNTITIANNSPTDEGVIEDATTARTARRDDLNKTVHATNSAGLAITIPLASAAGWTIGNVLYALQGAAGAVQYVGASGVTFEPSDSEQTRALGSLIAVKMIADDVWEAVGDLAYFAPATTLTGNPSNASAQPVNIALAAEGHVLVRRSGVLVSAQVKASEVVVTPTGNIASTNTQAALAELDTEKVDKAQLASAAGAGLVGNTPAGNVAATTVQAAINELDSEKIAKSLLTAKGDLIVGGTAGAPQRLAIGATGQVPTAQADGSLAYATPSAVGGELLVANGITPPVMLTNSDESDFVYQSAHA